MKGFFPWEAEISAVSLGRKPVAMYEISAEGSLSISELEDAAQKASLRIVSVPRAKAGEFRAFVCPPQEEWRARAYCGAFDAILEHDEWSWGAEAMSSFILGYTPEQTSAWIGYWRWRRVDWSSVTVYAVADRRQLMELLSTGFRSISLDMVRDEFALLLPSNSRWGVVAPMPEGLPRGSAIVRFGVSAEAASSMFQRGIGVVSCCSINVSLVDSLNMGIRTELEILSPSGWERAASVVERTAHE